MHVAYIHQHFSTRAGATGTRSYEMSQCLIEAGHQVSVICGVNDATDKILKHDQRVNKLLIDGINVYCIAERFENRMSFARRLWSFWSFANTAAQVVASLDADVVYATSTPLSVGLPGMKGARRLGAPFVFEVRDLWPELPVAMGVLKNPLLIWYARRLERKIYATAKHIVALSPGMKEGICRVGVEPARVTMIPNSCDLDLFKPATARLDDARFGTQDEFRLVFTGAHGLANGLDAVVDAAVELKRRGEQGIRFVFIGQGGLRDALIARCQAEGVDHMTTWLKFIPKLELAQAVPRMNAGMMILKNVPEFYYGTSPNKFFDYIASGIPVINNYPGWVADMLNEHKCGLVTAPGDAAAFADAVVWLRDHPDEARAMGARGRKLAEMRFDRKQLGRTLVATLERVHAQHPRRT